VFFRNGRPLRRGELLRQPALAATLLTLRHEGPGAFYRGSIARDLVDGVRAAGGNWTLDDLAAYQAKWRRPGRVELDRRRGIEWWTMPPPSSGSVVLGQTAAFMDRQRADLFSPWSAERARAWIESFRLSFADRNEHLADPANMEFSWRELVDPHYLRMRCRLLPKVGEIGRSDWVGPGWPGSSSPRPSAGGTPRQRREGQDTTHLVVIDARGDCVSLTTTLNALYGSGFLEPHTGIFLNDEMDDFDTRPGKPNLYGLVGNGRNAVRGGARMLSSMSPSIVLRDGRVWLALGGRGGPRILSGVAQVMYSRVFDDWPLDRAVAAPRIHHQWLPDEVRLEKGRIWPGLESALEAMGYTTRVASTNGKIHAAEVTPDGRFFGVADPRDHGLARCVD
jgi:gamma-glutamyltranspeptidase/glutathione hydrolase